MLSLVSSCIEESLLFCSDEEREVGYDGSCFNIFALYFELSSLSLSMDMCSDMWRICGISFNILSFFFLMSVSVSLKAKCTMIIMFYSKEKP